MLITDNFIWLDDLLNKSINHKYIRTTKYKIYYPIEWLLNESISSPPKQKLVTFLSNLYIHIWDYIYSLSAPNTGYQLISPQLKPDWQKNTVNKRNTLPHAPSHTYTILMHSNEHSSTYFTHTIFHNFFIYFTFRNRRKFIQNIYWKKKNNFLSSHVCRNMRIEDIQYC